MKVANITTQVLGILLLALSASTHAQSIVGTWDGSWEFFPSCTGCVAHDTFEDITVTSEIPSGGGSFSVAGNITECYNNGTPCGTSSWTTGTLSGHALSLDFNPSAANSFEGYDLDTTISTNGKSMSGEWIPVGTGYPSYVVSGSCSANEANGYCNTYHANLAPEMDRSSSAGATALLLGLLAVLRGRRRSLIAA